MAEEKSFWASMRAGAATLIGSSLVIVIFFIPGWSYREGYIEYYHFPRILLDASFPEIMQSTGLAYAGAFGRFYQLCNAHSWAIGIGAALFLASIASLTFLELGKYGKKIRNKTGPFFREMTKMRLRFRRNVKYTFRYTPNTYYLSIYLSCLMFIPLGAILYVNYFFSQGFDEASDESTAHFKHSIPLLLNKDATDIYFLVICGDTMCAVANNDRKAIRRIDTLLFLPTSVSLSTDSSHRS